MQSCYKGVTELQYWNWKCSMTGLNLSPFSICPPDVLGLSPINPCSLNPTSSCSPVSHSTVTLSVHLPAPFSVTKSTMLHRDFAFHQQETESVPTWTFFCPILVTLCILRLVLLFLPVCIMYPHLSAFVSFFLLPHKPAGYVC